MKLSDFINALDLEVLTPAKEDAEVAGGYCGDLLSWVMGRAVEGGAWMTIMTNVNIVAVAVLSGVSCVCVCEGAKPDAAAIEKATAQGVCLLGTDKPAFEVAGQLYALLKEEK